MRRAPENTLSKLQAYDPDLDLVWDGEIARWFLTYKRQRVCALYHDDTGEPWINLDGCGDALVANVRRMDTHYDKATRLRAMALAAKAAPSGASDSPPTETNPGRGSGRDGVTRERRTNVAAHEGSQVRCRRRDRREHSDG